MPIKIDNGVPLVVNRRKFPFGDLAVGDSFAVSPEDDVITDLGLKRAMARLRSSLVSSARAYSARHGIKLVVRKFNNDTFRVWRVDNVD